MPPKKSQETVVKAEAKAGEGRHRVKHTSFARYISKVLHQIHPNLGISRNAMNEMVSFTNDMGTRIGTEAQALARSVHKQTVGARDVMFALASVLPGELHKHAKSEATKAVTKYSASEAGKKAKGMKKSASTRAGLQFRVGKDIRAFLGSKHQRVSMLAKIALAAVLEYLCAEILELSGNASKENKRQRITPRSLKLAVANDAELAHLLSNVTVAHGGVLPGIHGSLIPKKHHKKEGAAEKPKKRKASKKKASSKKAKKTKKASSKKAKKSSVKKAIAAAVKAEKLAVKAGEAAL